MRMAKTVLVARLVNRVRRANPVDKGPRVPQVLRAKRAIRGNPDRPVLAQGAERARRAYRKAP